MRGPLHAIAIAAELLLAHEEVQSSRDTRGQVTSIYQGALWLQGLLENLLYAERLRTDRLATNMRPVDLAEVLAECAQVVEPLLGHRQQQLTLHVQPRLPRTLGDPRHLAQVLMNLIFNASKFSAPDTTIEVRLECARTQAGDFVRLSVADQGPGLPPDHEQLFAPFVAGATAAGRRNDGLGLGLSIAHEIVRAHGGRIGASNRPEGGSLFWFEVPASAVPEAPSPGPSTVSSQPAPLQARRPISRKR
jgi:signal transduction histidine kinase